MTMKKTTWVFLTAALIPAVLLLSACNPLEKKTQSSTFIIVESILGTDINGGSTNYLQSDVTKSGTIVADIASATFKASLLDPASILDPSQYNDVFLDRYVVSYSRVDGKNQQGVDVPYSFEGSLSLLLKVGTSTGLAFVVVREVAKMEPPLINLVNVREENVLQVTARIDFYGHDLANHQVTATGYLPIFFADYADSAAQ